MEYIFGKAKALFGSGSKDAKSSKDLKDSSGSKDPRDPKASNGLKASSGSKVLTDLKDFQESKVPQESTESKISKVCQESLIGIVVDCSCSMVEHIWSNVYLQVNRLIQAVGSHRVVLVACGSEGRVVPELQLRPKVNYYQDTLGCGFGSRFVNGFQVLEEVLRTKGAAHKPVKLVFVTNGIHSITEKQIQKELRGSELSRKSISFNTVGIADSELERYVKMFQEHYHTDDSNPELYFISNFHNPRLYQDTFDQLISKVTAADDEPELEQMLEDLSGVASYDDEFETFGSLKELGSKNLSAGAQKGPQKKRYSQCPTASHLSDGSCKDSPEGSPLKAMMTMKAQLSKSAKVAKPGLGGLGGPAGLGGLGGSVGLGGSLGPPGPGLTEGADPMALLKGMSDQMKLLQAMQELMLKSLSPEQQRELRALNGK